MQQTKRGHMNFQSKKTQLKICKPHICIVPYRHLCIRNRCGINILLSTSFILKGAFTHYVKTILSENLGGILGGSQC